MSGDRFLVCIYVTTIPLQTVRMWEEARFSADNAAQNPCLEAGSHVVNDQRPYGNAHGRHSCKPILSEARKLELLF